MDGPKAPRIGDTVFWYDGGDKDGPPHVAFVTAVGFDNLCVSVLERDSPAIKTRDGVRHVDDPRAKSTELLEAGGWEHRAARFAREDAAKAEKAKAKAAVTAKA